MINIKIEKSILMSIATLLVSGSIYLLRDNLVTLAVIITLFIGVVGLAFLGIDLLKMIKNTEFKPAGEFKTMNKWKYYSSFVVFILLSGEAVLIEHFCETSLGVIYGLTIAGAIAVIGLIVGGLNLNGLTTIIKDNLLEGEDKCGNKKMD